ncbi:MAG TPA: T9SS type A sorting domain-containing protein [Saprospiraceae bacterium]|nr:T9SS type A sorting domain-containing protein [Saprospiraceae bacterium]
MKKLILALSIVCATLFEAAPLQAQFTVPDSLFGRNSLYRFTPTGTVDGVGLLRQSDGTIIYGASVINSGDAGYYIDMVAIDHCGSVKLHFGNRGYTHHRFDLRNVPHVFALQPDDKILCGGIQAPGSSGSQQLPFIARFNANGTPDSSFAQNGSYRLAFDDSSPGTVFSIEQQADGKILAIGTCNCAAAGIMRFTPEGILDSSFNGTGKVLQNIPNISYSSEVFGHLQNDGSLIVVAARADAKFIDHWIAFKLNTHGAIDSSFGHQGFFKDTTNMDIYNHGFASAEQSNGSVVLAGLHLEQDKIVMIRINPNGIKDSSFGNSGHIVFEIPGAIPKKIRILQNGQIMVMGSYNLFPYAFGLLLDEDGHPVPGFGSKGFAVYDLNLGSGTVDLTDILEIPKLGWYLASSTNEDLLIGKFAEISNVPHISQPKKSELVTTGSGRYQWFHDNTTIPGATAKILPISKTGNYRVRLTDHNNCGYLSTPYTVLVVDAENPETEFIAIQPNPADDLIRISGPAAGSEYRIHQASGKWVQSGLLNTDGTIELGDILPGFYWIFIEDRNGKSYRGKWVKQ